MQAAKWLTSTGDPWQLDPSRVLLSANSWGQVLQTLYLFFGMVRRGHGRQVVLSLSLLQQGTLLAEFLGLLIYRGTAPGSIANYFERLGFLAKFMASETCPLGLNRTHAKDVVGYMRVRSWAGALTGAFVSWGFRNPLKPVACRNADHRDRG